MLMNNSAQRIIRFIENNSFQVISFDVFDTLICRNISKPEYVFKLMERFEPCKDITNFSKIRIRAERECRIEYGREITLNEIYTKIKDYVGNVDLEKIKKLELETELAVCQANHIIKQVYDYCKSRRFRIIVASDMYLSKICIEKLLAFNGYDQFDAFYISSELQKTKSKGDIFEHILKSEGIQASKVLHIGDNFRSDIFNARLKGISTYWIRKQNLMYYNLDESLLRNFLNNSKKNTDAYFDIGYKYFGPLLLGFSHWLRENFNAKRYDYVLFLSRDGYYMKEAYEKLYDDNNIIYFYASRRLLNTAAISLNPEYESIAKRLAAPIEVSLGWLIDKWGLKESYYLYETRLKESGYTLDTVFSGLALEHNEEVRAVFELLKEDIVRNSEVELNALKNHINSLGISGNVAIVDIGWNGNMQKSMSEILSSIDCLNKIEGYYVGIRPKSTIQNEEIMYGFICQKGKNQEKYDTFKFMINLLEVMFVAPHGSASKYQDIDGHTDIILKDFEYTGKKQYDSILNMQKGAMVFIKNYKKYAKFIEDDVVYTKPFIEQFMHPSYEIASLIGKLQSCDYDMEYLAKPKGRWYYIVHPTIFINDFVNCSWKYGFIKLLFGFNLPYEFLFPLLNKIYVKYIEYKSKLA